LPISKLRLFLLIPLETRVFVKGWPKRGRWALLFHHDQTEDETSEIPQTDGHLLIPLSEIKLGKNHTYRRKQLGKNPNREKLTGQARKLREQN
jgi:hypothetical protein